MQDNKTGAVLRTAPPESKNLVGAQCAFYVVDELHVLGTIPRAGSIIRQLEGGAVIFDKGRGVMISTVPIGTSAGVYQSMYARAQRILAGEEPHNGLLPVIFELPREAWEDLDNHRHLFWMANPSMGRTFPEDSFFSEYDASMADPDPERKRDFLSQRLNIPAAEVMGVENWIPLAKWDRYADESLTLERLIFEAEYIYVGLDAGLRDDPSAMLVLGQSGDKFTAWSMQWLHNDGFEKRKTQAEYENFRDNGELTVVNPTSHSRALRPPGSGL